MKDDNKTRNTSLRIPTIDVKYHTCQIFISSLFFLSNGILIFTFVFLNIN